MKHPMPLVLLSTILVAGAGGCGRPTHSAKTTGGESMETQELIEHIGKEHGIRIAADPAADIVIAEASNRVTVTFSAAILKALPPDCLTVLHFDTPTHTFTREQFDAFIENLHDYLLVTYGEGKGPRKAVATPATPSPSS